MKKTITFAFASLVVNFSNAQAPDSWTEKSGIGLNVPASNFISPRKDAVSFCSNSKAYIGTGLGDANYKDFYEFNPATNIFTQKTNFGGIGRVQGVGFFINNKGYLGTGTNGSCRNDFWEYDPANNSWTQKANCGGGIREKGVGFAIGNKGYVGTGDTSYTGSGLKNDFWEYDPSTNIWTQKANFGGTPRNEATAFCIGNKGYIGTGFDGALTKDLWEYDPSANIWAQKAYFGGTSRSRSTGFSIGNKGYLGLGYGTGGPPFKNDFWEYDPLTNIWTQKADFGGVPRADATGFSIGNKGYIGTGFNTYDYFNDFWEYDPALNTWTQNVNSTLYGRSHATGFSIRNKGYIGTGYGNADDFWEYDSGTNGWYQKSAFTVIQRYGAAGFSIGNNGYIGTGELFGAAGNTNDFWEFNVAANTWTQKANFGGAARQDAIGFNIGNKGYIGTGRYPYSPSAYFIDFWEYDLSTNSWTQKSDYPGNGRGGIAGFSIGNKGYMGTGHNYISFTSYYYTDFWEYDPSTNNWLQKASFGGVARGWAAGFSIGNKGYIGTGSSGISNRYKDFWEFDPSANTWTQRANFGGSARDGAVGFSIASKGFFVTGNEIDYSRKNDLWEYTPICSTPVSTIYSSGNISFCSADSVFLYANNGYNYQWKKNGIDITGATSYFYYTKATGSYSCYLSNSCGAVTSSSISVTVSTLPSATITPAGPTTFCSGGSVVLNAPAGANKTYQWKKGANLISGATLSSYTVATGGNYRVIVTNTVTGCSKTTNSATTVTVNALPAATITPQGPTTFCAGGSVVLQANTGTGLTYKWKKGSNFISGATLSNYTATTGGNYRVQVTNGNGCSKTSALVAVSVPCKEGEIILSGNDFDVKVFPNPSSRDFVFEIKDAEAGKTSIHVYDVIGKSVLSERNIDSQFTPRGVLWTIRNSELVPGIYSAEIICGENKKVVKLIKTE